MRNLPRRVVLAGLAAFPAAAQAAPEPVTLVVPAIANMSALDFLNAKVGGHFAAQGLDVAFETTTTGVGAMQQLVAGRADFIKGGAVELIRVVARQNVGVLSVGNADHSVDYVLVSGPDRPIRDAAMLRGKRIGVTAFGSTSDIYLDLMLHRAGLPREAVERQAVPASPASFALVGADRLDGLVLPIELAWPLVHPVPGAPAPPVVVLPVGSVVTMPGRCYLTTSAMVAQKPAHVAAFIKGIIASMREIIAGPAEPLIARSAAAFDITHIGSMPENVAAVQSIVRGWLVAGPAQLMRNIEDDWQAGVTIMAEAGLATLPPGKTLYTNRFVDQVPPP